MRVGLTDQVAQVRDSKTHRPLRHVAAEGPRRVEFARWALPRSRTVGRADLLGDGLDLPFGTLGSPRVVRRPCLLGVGDPAIRARGERATMEVRTR